MFKKAVNPVVKFTAPSDALDTFPHPVKAQKKIPEWYRKLQPTVPKGTVMDGTAKRCIPVLDAMSQGYIIPLWCDVIIRVFYPLQLFDDKGRLLHQMHGAGRDAQSVVGEQITDLEGKPFVHAASYSNQLAISVDLPPAGIADEKEPVGQHPWGQVGDLCNLKHYKFGKDVFKFHNPWSIETPSGWSCYFKNPANSFETNIHCLEGFVDTDAYTVPVNFPFVWTGSEEGEFLIKKGTPLVQVIPYERIETKHVVSVVDAKKRDKIQQKLDTTLYDRYKRIFWHKRHKYDVN